MPAVKPPPRRLDFIRFLGLEYSATYKEWHARLEVKDSATAIRQNVLGKVGRPPRLLDPKSRSFSFKLTRLDRGATPGHAGAFLILELSDGQTQRLGLGQIMLRDTADPQWRHYDAPESEERFDHNHYA